MNWPKITLTTPTPTWWVVGKEALLCVQGHGIVGGLLSTCFILDFGITKCIILFYFSMLRRHKRYTKLRENTFSHRKAGAIKHHLKKNFCRTISLQNGLNFSAFTPREGWLCTGPIEDPCSNPDSATHEPPGGLGILPDLSKFVFPLLKWESL